MLTNNCYGCSENWSTSIGRAYRTSRMCASMTESDVVCLTFGDWRSEAARGAASWRDRGEIEASEPGFLDHAECARKGRRDNEVWPAICLWLGTCKTVSP